MMGVHVLEEVRPEFPSQKSVINKAHYDVKLCKIELAPASK